MYNELKKDLNLTAKKIEISINWKPEEKEKDFTETFNMFSKMLISQLGRKRTALLAIGLLMLALDLMHDEIPEASNSGHC